VQLRHGTPQLREVKVSEATLDAREQQQREVQAKAATAAGFDYVRITRQELAQHRQLIVNWRCALTFLAAARELVLSPFGAELLGILRKESHLSLDTLLSHTDPALRSIY